MEAVVSQTVKTLNIEVRPTVTDETAALCVFLLNAYLDQGEHSAFVWEVEHDDRPATCKLEIARRCDDDE